MTYYGQRPSACHTIAGNLGLVVTGFLFFPAVLLSLVMFMVSLLLFSVCLAAVAVVKFSHDIIHKRNGTCETSKQIMH